MRNAALISVVAILLLTLSNVATAGSNSRHGNCRIASTLAKSIMKARQGSVSMPEVMEMVNKHESFGAMGTMLVELAFKRPRYHSDREIEIAVVEFESDTYAACIEAEGHK